MVAFSDISTSNSNQVSADPIADLRRGGYRFIFELPRSAGIRTPVSQLKSGGGRPKFLPVTVNAPERSTTTQIAY
jgi:hypothetical protein